MLGSAMTNKWKLTPWWVFWRPKWCRLTVDVSAEQANWWRKHYEYATDEQRAHQILKETFDNDR